MWSSPPACSLLRLLRKGFPAMLAVFRCAPVCGLAADPFPALPGAFVVVIIWSVSISRSVLPSLFSGSAPPQTRTRNNTLRLFAFLPTCLRGTTARKSRSHTFQAFHPFLLCRHSIRFLHLQRSFVPDSLFSPLYVCVQRLPAQYLLIAVGVQTGFFWCLFQGHS